MARIGSLTLYRKIFGQAERSLLKRLLLSCIAGLISFAPALAAAPSCDEDKQPDTIDPVFKLDLPARFYAAHYQPVPLALIQQCGLTAKHGDYDYRYWTFAAVDDGPNRYFILGGLWRDNDMSQDNPDKQRGVWVPDKFGSMDEITDGKCTAISWPIDVFCTADFGPPSAAVLSELAADAVKRYEAAFGSQEKFIDELKEQQRIPEDPDLKFLNQALASAK